MAYLRSIPTAGLAIGLLLAASAPAAQTKERLTNGGFEDGTTGWQPDAKHEVLRDAKAAHAGKACLTGEITRPSQALRLHRRVPVRAGNLYKFTIWARATKRTKLVLWAMVPGRKTRVMIASWRAVPSRWTRYVVPITIQATGTLELQIIAPSSYGEPAGRIWVDDVSLVETDLPPVLSVSQDQGFNDEPALAAAGSGSVVVAWNSFRDGADSLQVARYRLAADKPAETGRWQVVGGKGTYVLGVTATPAGDKAAVLYAAEVEKNWDIYAVFVGAGGPGKPLRLTSHAGVDVKPSAAWRDGKLYVAWESNRGGSRQVFATTVQNGTSGKPQAVSPDGVNAYDPSLAVLACGQVCVAWHAFGENNYDIYLRRRPVDGEWDKVRRLTQASTIDRHAVLAARGDDLWLVYENAQCKTYHVGATNKRRLVVAKLAAKGLLAPKGWATSPLAGRTEAASPAFDETGRLWLGYLIPRLPRAGWDVRLTCLAGGKWMRPWALFGLKGMDRRPQLALLDGKAVLCFQGDNIPNSWSTVDKTPDAKSNIYLAVNPLAEAPGNGPPDLEPLVEPAEEFEAAAIRVARGEDMPSPSTTYQGKKLTLFFGDLHEHTDVSVCNRTGDQTIDESYQHMRDIARHDFACVTDHGYNINPYLWGLLGKLARTNYDAGRYCTFLGEEWTSSFEKYSVEHPYGYYGHRNLILADPYFPRWWNARNGQTPAQVWDDLRKMKANFVHIPHQLADTGNVPVDWNFTDEKAQPVAEIFQTRGSYEYKGTVREAKRTTPKRGYFLQDAWARGIVIGVIASPDHGGGYGKACVWAPELTREAILDALRRRHCYGTSAAKIVLDVRVNGHLMGEKVAEPAGKSVEVKISARCPGEIERIEVCRNNVFLYTTSPKGTSADLTFTDRKPLPGRSYYYVRVVQKDQELAWSSPVWLGAK